MIALLRIDDKLIHAQMIWGWVRVLKASCIIVANDEAAHDDLRRKLLIMAAQSASTISVSDETKGMDLKPIPVRILSLKETVGHLKRGDCSYERSILVVSKPSDVVLLLENGLSIKNVSVGWMSFFPGKKRILETVSVDEKDIAAFRKLIGKGIAVKYQASPSDTQLDMADCI